MQEIVQAEMAEQPKIFSVEQASVFVSSHLVSNASCGGKE